MIPFDESSGIVAAKYPQEEHADGISGLDPRRLGSDLDNLPDGFIAGGKRESIQSAIPSVGIVEVAGTWSRVIDPNEHRSGVRRELRLELGDRHVNHVCRPPEIGRKLCDGCDLFGIGMSDC